MLWEAKDVYSAPFMLFILLPAQEGISKTAMAIAASRRLPRVRRGLYAFFTLLSVMACALVPWLASRQAVYAGSRIDSLLNDRVNAPITAETNISQTFTVAQPFNRMTLSCEPADATAEPSAYRLTLSDDVAVLFSRDISVADIHEGQLMLDFDTLPEGNHYRLDIEKLSPDRPSLLFYTKYTYLYDLYPGELSSDTRAEFPCDLMMNVDQVARSPWASGWRLAALTAFYALFAVTAALPLLRRLLSDEFCKNFIKKHLIS